EDFDLHLPIGLCFEFLRPRFDNVDLKETGGPEKMAEPERDGIGHRRGNFQRQQSKQRGDRNVKWPTHQTLRAMACERSQSLWHDGSIVINARIRRLEQMACHWSRAGLCSCIISAITKRRYAGRADCQSSAFPFTRVSEVPWLRPRTGGRW